MHKPLTASISAIWFYLDMLAYSETRLPLSLLSYELLTLKAVNSHS